MVQERPKRPRKKGKVQAKKAQPRKAQPKKVRPKKVPVLKDEQLPGLLEGEIPRGVPVTEEEAAEAERPLVVAEEEAAEAERTPVVAEKEATGAVAVSARAPESTKGPGRRTVLAEKLMSVPEFRQRVVKLVVRKFS